MRKAWMLVAGVAVVACGSTAPSSSPSESLPAPGASADGVIEVGSDSELARMVDGSEPVRVFEAAPGVVFDAGRAGRWQMSTEPATVDEARRLADVLGVAGDVGEVDDGLGRGLGIGTVGGDADWFRVSSVAEPFWTSGRSEAALVEAGAIPCPTVPFDDPNGAGCVDGATSEMVGPPDDETVSSAVTSVMSGLGVPDDDYRIETITTPSTAEVSVEFSPDQLRSDVRWSLTISSNGDVLSGSGPLRAPVRVDDVATVGLDEVLLRLSRLAGDIPVMPPLELTPPTPTSVPTLPPPSIDTTNDPRSTPPPPSTTPPPLPVIRRIDAGLVSVWDITNRKWLVPAVVVTGDNGFTTAIPTIATEMVRVVDADTATDAVRTGPPLTLPAPPPPTSISPPTQDVPPTTWASPVPPTMSPDPSAETMATLPVPPDQPMALSEIPAYYGDALNQALVGQQLETSLDRLSQAGWDVRTDDIDDPTETFLTDMRVDRATVQHRNGIVVAVTIG